ncbi:accessory gene regulator ArgB-like protein [Paenibacillus sp. FSL L8-0463]|uniref:accessory gene regulator ArgB-like protein n=1 Tax=Paenibacillus sp. FSL L8-0463 TaxID=2954687 RepID=UPI0040541605
MVDNLALSIARKIKNTVPDHPSSVDVLKYALIVILNTMFGIVLSLLISILTGKMNEVIVIILSFAVLRQISGGYHIKSSDGCVIFSVFLFTSLSLISLNSITILILNCSSVLLALFFSPSKIDEQSKIPRKYYPYLKIMSVLLITINFYLQSSIIALAFFSQCISLIRLRRT